MESLLTKPKQKLAIIKFTVQEIHTFLLSLLARALAIIVLPVPGGPWNNNTIPAP